MAERIQHIAGIIFALAFVALLALLNTNAINIGQNVNRQLSRTSTASETYELQAFDGTTVTGATVISAIKNYDALTAYDMAISVVTKSGSVSVTTTYGAGGTYVKYDPTSQPANTRITPTKSFRAELVENINGILNGVKFTEI